MIRLVRPSDLPALRLVEASAASMYCGTRMDFAAATGPNRPGDLSAALGRGLMWVAEEDGAVVGFLFAEPVGTGLYLRDVAVAVPSQRRGHGRALVLAGIAAGRARHDRMVTLTTDREIVWNAPFYAKLGFEIVEGDAIPLESRRRLAGQLAAGFDPRYRCAMTLEIA